MEECFCAVFLFKFLSDGFINYMPDVVLSNENSILDSEILTYFPKMKVGVSNHQSCLSICVSPTNNFRTASCIIMKFDTEIKPFKGTLMQ
jgi:hypothetical protein